MKLFTRPQAEENEEHWIPVSDLMAGLMIVFLFISIAFIFDKLEEVKKDRNEQESIGAVQQEFEIKQHELKIELNKIFKNDDGIEVKGLVISFTNIKEFFEQGQFELLPNFKEKLNRFIPKYFNTIKKYEDYIIEIRIDGHTSKEWGKDTKIYTAHEKESYTKEQRAYLRNMKLSQDRARVVLDYVLFGNVIGKHKKWVEPILTANGLSSSRLADTPEKSRRVEFVVVMKGSQR